MRHTVMQSLCVQPIVTYDRLVSTQNIKKNNVQTIAYAYLYKRDFFQLPEVASFIVKCSHLMVSDDGTKACTNLSGF